jgi:hypothetical protein
VTTSRLNSCGNFFGIATSFRPDPVGHKECQPNRQQSPVGKSRSDLETLASQLVSTTLKEAPTLPRLSGWIKGVPVVGGPVQVKSVQRRWGLGSILRLK